jgi:hypothetical protein
MSRRRVAAVLAVFCFVLRARAASSAADDQVLPVTVQVPFGFLFLQVPAFSAIIPPDDAWAFDVGLTSGNNFMFSDNVSASLARHASRVPMTKAEFDAIVAAHPGEDVYYIDDEVYRLAARFGRTVAPSVRVGAVVSAVSISGGSGMDAIIEGFHEDFGFPAMYRDVVPRGETTTALSLRGREEFLSPSARSGIDDPVVFATWAPERRFGAWRMSVVSGVKIPIASTSKRLSTGSFDFGAAYAATGSWGRWSLNLNAGAVVPGHIEFLDGLDASPMLAASASVGCRFSATSLWLQLQWEQSPFRGATSSALGDDAGDLTVGLRFPMGGRVRGFFAFTENPLGVDNSTDIAFHFGVTWTTRSK